LGFLISAAACRDADDDDVFSSDEVNAVDHSALSNTKTELELEQFATWVSDKENNLTKNKTISDINYQLAYLPKEYMAYTELKQEKNLTQERFEEVKKNYTGMTYFKFRIETKSGSGELLKYKLSSGQQYNERIDYMSFRMQEDIILVQGKDTLYPGMYHFERIYDIAPFATVMMAFDNKKFNPDGEFTIVFNDHLFHKGYIKYYYRTKQLIDLPNISGVWPYIKEQN
jgi:hypothetical protein